MAAAVELYSRRRLVVTEAGGGGMFEGVLTVSDPREGRRQSWRSVPARLCRAAPERNRPVPDQPPPSDRHLDTPSWVDGRCFADSGASLDSWSSLPLLRPSPTPRRKCFVELMSHPVTSQPTHPGGPYVQPGLCMYLQYIIIEVCYV